MSAIKSILETGITGLLLSIDGIVYWLVNMLFSLYNSLAGAEILKEVAYEKLLDRVYVIIGVFMLFTVAYSLLKALVNPDNLSKDTGKIVTNIIISLVLLSIVPTIFKFAREVQNVIVTDNIIGNIMLVDNTDIEKMGTNATLQTLEAFVQIPDDVEGNLTLDASDVVIANESCGLNLNINSFTNEDLEDRQQLTWGETKQLIECGQDDAFLKIAHFSEAIHEGVEGEKYIFIISTICGAFMAYVLLSFCIDLGIRVVKLAFYQIIAPLPILMRIIPEKKSVFDNWVKGTLATYLEVFIRIFIMMIIVFLIDQIFNGDIIGQNSGSDIGIFGKVLIAMGLFAFAKQAPKLIGDVIGVDSGNIKLGIGGKLAAGGALGVAAMLGGAATTGVRNLANIGNRWRDAKGKGFWSHVGAVTGGLAGVAPGIISGGVRSAKGGFSAKNFKDVRTAAGAGAKGATDARDNRAAYKATHGGTIITSMAGHVVDSFKNAAEWAGGGFEAEESKIKSLNDLLAGKDRAKSAAETLRDKNDNNIDFMNEVAKRYASGQIAWKGSPEQKDKYAKLLNTLKDSEGNQLTLAAMRSRIDAMAKEKIELDKNSFAEEFTNNIMKMNNWDSIDGHEDEIKRDMEEAYSKKLSNMKNDHSILVANYQNMLNQLEKASMQTIQSAAFDTNLAKTIGIEDSSKFSGIVSEISDINNQLKNIGRDTVGNDNVGAVLDDTMTNIENEKNDLYAKVERMKRASEARKKNSGGGK